MRLISRADLARRAGVSRAAVTQQCKRRLLPAVSGNRIDVSHECVQAWLAELRSADVGGGSALARAPATQDDPTSAAVDDPDGSEVVTVEGADGADFSAYADLTLRQLTKRFGTARAFSDWLEAMRKLEAIRGLRIQNEETIGQLIDRDMVQTHVFGTLDGMCRRLLTDASKTIARRLDAAANAGESLEARELVAQEIIGSIIRPAKEQVAKALRNPSG